MGSILSRRFSVNDRLSPGDRRFLKGAGILVAAMGCAWVLAKWIIAGELSGLTLVGIAVACLAFVVVSRWWRGTYVVLAWLVFEDLPRKYLGNNMTIFFAKDALLALVYLAFLMSRQRKDERGFRPSFWFPLLAFAALAFVQTFNPNTPSILYGIIGLKVYFYYVPLMFIGYALIRSQEDLDRFLSFNLVLAVIVSAIGIIQAVGWPNFLNPPQAAPELQELSHLIRHAPLTGEPVFAPPSIFVSTGRFSTFMILMFILALGSAGYELMRQRSAKRRWLLFLALGLTGLAALLCGSRGAFIYCFATVMVLTFGLQRGAKFLSVTWSRLMKAIRLALVAATVCILIAVFFFPNVVGASWSFYYQTLSPESPASELSTRVASYPMQNLQRIFEYPDWWLGYGTGSCSLSTLYVAYHLNQPLPLVPGTENGIGALILEMGILAPFLWLLWAGTLIVSGWRVVRRLRRTALYPVGLAIWWFAFILLFPMTYGGLVSYQNYVLNACLWLLVGILFRLPSLVVKPAQNGAIAR